MKISDLKPQRIRFDITMFYEKVIDPITKQERIQGRNEIITMQLPTKHRWEEIGFMIDDPAPPLDVKTGKPDYTSMRSITERNRAEYQRTVLRLAEALTLGGDFEWEADNPDLFQQAEELKEIDDGLFEALYTTLRNATSTFVVKVSASAENFPSGNGNGRVSKSKIKDFEPQALES